MNQLFLVANTEEHLRAFDVTSQEHTYCHFYHCLDTSRLILVHFIYSDVVFAILSRRDMGHDAVCFGKWSDKKFEWVLVLIAESERGAR